MGNFLSSFDKCQLFKLIGIREIFSYKVKARFPLEIKNYFCNCVKGVKDKKYSQIKDFRLGTFF